MRNARNNQGDYNGHLWNCNSVHPRCFDRNPSLSVSCDFGTASGKAEIYLPLYSTPPCLFLTVDHVVNTYYTVSQKTSCIPASTAKPAIIQCLFKKLLVARKLIQIISIYNNVFRNRVHEPHWKRHYSVWNLTIIKIKNMILSSITL